MTPWTVACQAPLSMGFPRQEYWSGLPFPSSGDLPDPGIEATSPVLVGGFFTVCATWLVISVYMRAGCILDQWPYFELEMPGGFLVYLTAILFFHFLTLPCQHSLF